MRGIIFNSMISTTVTMPAMVLLGVMGAYWLHRRCFPDSSPKKGAYALLAALLPMVFMVYLWPPGYVPTGKFATVVCTYVVYYLVGAALYAVCREMADEARARAFRFFFVALLAAFMLGMLVSFRMASDILSLFGLIAVVWAVVYVVMKTATSPLWTWTPPKPAPEERSEEMPEETTTEAPVAAPPAFRMDKLLIYGVLIICVAWLCLYLYALRPFYVPVVLFWMGLAGVAMARRADAVRPSPSQPSPGID